MTRSYDGGGRQRQKPIGVPVEFEFPPESWQCDVVYRAIPAVDGIGTAGGGVPFFIPSRKLWTWRELFCTILRPPVPETFNSSFVMASDRPEKLASPAHKNKPARRRIGRPPPACPSPVLAIYSNDFFHNYSNNN